MKATIYSKNDCPWCEAAISMLKDHGFTDLEIKKYNVDYTKVELFDLVLTAGGNVKQLTVPQVWIDDKYVGTYEDLKNNYIFPSEAISFNDQYDSAVVEGFDDAFKFDEKVE